MGEKRRLRRSVVWLAVLVPVVAVLYFAVTLVQVRLTADSDDGSDSADAAIVLGAAQYDGTPSPVLAKRLDEAYDLYMGDLVESIVLTGANADGDRFTEAYSGFTYLRQKGVAEDDLIIVDDGTSTWESLAASGRVLEASGVDQVLLVSDPYHSHRLLGIADELLLHLARLRCHCNVDNPV